MMSSKFALIIGNSEYQDARLAQLLTPGQDAGRLAEVLQAQEIGGFDEVTPLINESESRLRRVINRFFARGTRDDLLLLYFSGHGVLDDQGLLYFATKDTEFDALSATAISAHFVRQEMDRSYSRRQVLILDCCNSGAFRRAKTGLGASVGTAATFEVKGYGRVVLTATDATQYAWEDEKITGEAANSVFTYYLIQGLQTGEADRDEDGVITLDELHDYVYEQVVKATPKQTPLKFVDTQAGQIAVARSPAFKYTALSIELRRAIDSQHEGVRRGAVKDLERLLKGNDPNLAKATYEFLKERAVDKSRTGSELAAKILSAYFKTYLVKIEVARKDKVGTQHIGDGRSADEQTEGIPLRSAITEKVEQSDQRFEEPLLVSDVGSTWELPQIANVLDRGPIPEFDERFDNERVVIIESTLSSYGAPARVLEINVGPTTTQFCVEPSFVIKRGRESKVKISDIMALTNELSLALAAHVRIESVPDRGYVGIEVPHVEASLVALRDVLDSDEFLRLKGVLRLGLGRDVRGLDVAGNLEGMRHLLITGVGGSGKSECVNAIIACLLVQNTPNDLRFLIIDPKRGRLTAYNGIPHLLMPVVTELDIALISLKRFMREMDERYHKFGETSARGIVEYNNHTIAGGDKRQPYLIIVIDELAELVKIASDEAENAIIALAQRGPAVGIHLIVTTQHPVLDVIRHLMYYFPTRLAFAAASSTESRLILDQGGAEHLLKRGDMLMRSLGWPRPIRIQGTYVSALEIQRLTDHWKSLGSFEVPTFESLFAFRGSPLESSRKDDDALLDQAIKIVREKKVASISMLQRHLRIGYSRAARLIDVLEQKGIIGPAQSGGKFREVVGLGDQTSLSNEQGSARTTSE